MHVITSVKTSTSIVIPSQTRLWPDVKPEKFCPYSITPSVPVATKLNVLRTADRVRLSGTNSSHRISSESQCVGIRSGPRTWLTSPDAVAELGCRLRSIKPAPSRPPDDLINAAHRTGSARSRSINILAGASSSSWLASLWVLGISRGHLGSGRYCYYSLRWR